MARRRLPEDNVPGLSDLATRLAGGYKTIGEMVYEVLREGITTGTLRPGQKLRQETIAEAIGVSRIPIRSALMQLEKEGLVTFKPHRGAMVRTLSKSQVRETYSVRALLETHALKLSIRTMTDERAEKLRKLANRLDRRRRGQDFLEDRLAFYHTLYDIDQNPVLVGVIDQLRGSLGRDLLERRLVDTNSGGHKNLHTELAELAIAGDLAGARRHLKHHLDAVCSAMLDAID